MVEPLDLVRLLEGTDDRSDWGVGKGIVGRVGVEGFDGDGAEGHVFGG